MEGSGRGVFVEPSESFPNSVFHPAMTSTATTRTRVMDGFFHRLAGEEGFTWCPAR
jgi:hypothetical protein